MDASTTGKLVFGFFAIIIGLVLIGSIADSTALATDKTDITNETLDISSARNDSDATQINASVTLTIGNPPEGWETTECTISNFVMRNQSGGTLTTVTDYVFAPSTGTLTLKNTVDVNQTGNTTAVDYTHCAQGYVNTPWARSILNLVAGFFALAILGVGLAVFYSVAKDAGIIGK